MFSCLIINKLQKLLEKIFFKKTYVKNKENKLQKYILMIFTNLLKKIFKNYKT